MKLKTREVRAFYIGMIIGAIFSIGWTGDWGNPIGFSIVFTIVILATLNPDWMRKLRKKLLSDGNVI